MNAYSIYPNAHDELSAYDKLRIARQNGRPTSIAYVQEIFTDHMELHGDRKFGDDPAIVGGVAFLDHIPVTYLAIEKGQDTQSRLQRNFGCPKPEGYRKALRLMKQAEKFGRPVICFVDTLGAFPGADAEERGQGQAIAENLMEMMGLQTPIISVIVGEGGSGGALALATADRVYMLEHAVYSVITPEGCASIIWKDSQKVEEAAECLRITAQDMVQFKVAETIIPEDFDHFGKMCKGIKQQLLADLDVLMSMPCHQMLESRYNRFRTIGFFNEKES